MGRGYVINSLNTHRLMAGEICFAIQKQILIIAYLLSPKHPFTGLGKTDSWLITDYSIRSLNQLIPRLLGFSQWGPTIATLVSAGYQRWSMT